MCSVELSVHDRFCLRMRATLVVVAARILHPNLGTSGDVVDIVVVPIDVQSQ
jgi:hypothetical protein